MSPSVFFRPEAEQDLRAAWDWYEDKRPGLGDEFLARIEAVLSRIQANPEQFPRTHHELRRALIRRFPYALFYLASSERIVVVAILHHHRDPINWRSRSG
jgi:toxin ParE1/3/4